MVLSYPAGWKTNEGAEDAIPSAPLDQLETLADWFGDRRPTLTQAGAEQLRRAISDTKEALEQDETLSTTLRLYIGRLLREIEAALDDERLSDRFDYEDAGQGLWVSLFAAAAQSTDEAAQSRWTTIARELFWPATAAMLGSAPQTILSIAAG